MCCCGKPTINGEPKAYSWDGKHFSTRQPNPPALEEGDELIYDEPGRCGGIDSHCHHFRVVKQRNWVYLLVRHGGGDERIRMGGCNEEPVLAAMARLDSNARYWLLQMIYSTVREATTYARNAEKGRWAMAAANKRIKTRKHPRGSVKVWIVPEATVPNTNSYTLC
jgi:hypothetical protein